jgi:hypothetical protein
VLLVMLCLVFSLVGVWLTNQPGHPVSVAEVASYIALAGFYQKCR